MRTTDTTTTSADFGIYTDTQASAFVLRIVEANPRHYERDMDAISEMGEVDTETALQGYIWADIEAELGDMDEETEEALASALVDFYYERYEEWQEYEDEDDPESDPDLQEYYEARLACEEASALYGTDSEEYRQACLAFEEAEHKAQVG